VTALTNLVELDDRWILNLRESRIIKISVDFRLTLTLNSGWEVVLEGRVLLSSGPLDARLSERLNPQTQDVAATHHLRGAEVRSAVAFKTGSLRMVFDTGTHLRCPVDPSYEAWHIAGPGGRQYVSLPGGGIAVWTDQHDTNGDGRGRITASQQAGFDRMTVDHPWQTQLAEIATE
jgi:hypothetical protein